MSAPWKLVMAMACHSCLALAHLNLADWQVQIRSLNELMCLGEIRRVTCACVCYIFVSLHRRLLVGRFSAFARRFLQIIRGT